MTDTIQWLSQLAFYAASPVSLQVTRPLGKNESWLVQIDYLDTKYGGLDPSPRAAFAKAKMEICMACRSVLKVMEPEEASALAYLQDAHTKAKEQAAKEPA